MGPPSQETPEPKGSVKRKSSQGKRKKEPEDVIEDDMAGYNDRFRPDKHGHHGKGMLMQAVLNHVSSFNAFVESGMEDLVACISSVDIEPWEEGGEGHLKVSLMDLTLSKPVNRPHKESEEEKKAILSAKEAARKWLPSDCRMAHATYGGALTAKFEIRLDGSKNATNVDVELGDVPVMVRSKACNLHAMSPEQLVEAREDCTESGGYFLLHGLERVIRLLIMPRSNFPMAITRPSYQSRGKLYTPHAVLMRSMRPDGTTQTNTLHYCRDGSCNLRFSHGREEWLIPLAVVAHSLSSVSDRMLVEMLAGGSVNDAQPGDEPGPNHDLWETVLVMLQQQNQKLRIGGQSDARRYLGRTFRIVLGNAVPRRYTDEQIGEWMVNKFFLVHTKDGWLKLNTLCVMFQKLMGLVKGEVEPDNQDTMSSHEVLHPGQLYGMVLKESLEVMMLRLKGLIRKLTKKEGFKSKYLPQDFLKGDTFRKIAKSASDIQKRMENFLATGNVTSRSGLDLMQVSGYTVVADKLNQARYSSHFAAIHRGQYFAEMKTTTVRKLLPETWGFLCPVHTPDGSPCGLLNHLAHSCRPVVEKTAEGAREAVAMVLAGIGATIWADSGNNGSPGETRGKHVWILIDGCPMGYIERSRLVHAEQLLRKHKVAGKHGVPKDMEIVCITKKWGKLFPGLFLFLGPGRLIRPVRCLRTRQTEWIGPLEQLFLNVSVLRAERDSAHEILDKRAKGEEAEMEDEIPEQLPVRFSHEELEPTELFSTLAALTPFSNHNQSPRNMYQCQMLKQTMATPYHNHDFRPDNKVFRIYCPQSPMVRTQMYESINCDEHPIGTNAVVAVITYTGYDMEDAMIINKQAYERGFGHGIVYKTKVLDAAAPRDPELKKELCHYTNVKTDGRGKVVERFSKYLNDDGFPPIGTYLKKGDDMYCMVNHIGEPDVHKYKDDEPCYVEQVVRLDGDGIKGSEPCKRVMLKLRYTRNPVVGDKFSSRHGQKGVMSILWPAEDMPFTEGGQTPDILFNPHGFPSRMTIGMLIESIAGKTAAMEAKKTADATTFREYSGKYNDEDNEGDPFHQRDANAGGEGAAIGGPKAAEYFGETLLKHGYKRLGTERMYSGIHGCEIETDIFVGIVYYQRLRHLVMDKAQVRNRGRVDRLTNQPVKGRKNHGGIRFGEMERDSLLAHGTSFLLHDRLMRSSDYDVAYVCPRCGSVLTPQANAGVHEKGLKSFGGQAGDPWECPPCSRKAKRLVRCHPMPIPWVFRYLSCELAAMNVRMNVQVTDRARQVSLSSTPWAGDAVA
eukprot:gb/GFBE01078154.1/.p1 GENE.gb/GFBE01078154.1/~~gb/GFBE01078154.1/.p1  ORF type:complete len:1293 (+),score=239.12 gb/GFBE01078154.1/:1-3879(+)